MKCSCPITDLEIHSFAFAPIDSRMYIVLDTSKKSKRAVVIDPCINEDAWNLLEQNEIITTDVILTHEHYDHISGVNAFRERFLTHVFASKYCALSLGEPRKNFSAYFDALFCTHPSDQIAQVKALCVKPYSCCADVTFSDDYQFFYGNYTFEMRVTQGHSKGSICILLDSQCLFSGDSLLRVPVVTKLPGGDKGMYIENTLPYLKSFDSDVAVYPGHGNYGKISTMNFLEVL